MKETGSVLIENLHYFQFRTDKVKSPRFGAIFYVIDSEK